MKKLLCRFPLWLKKIVIYFLSFFNKNKNEAIKELQKSSINQKEFYRLNDYELKKSLKKYLRCSITSSFELKNFISYLYNDEIKILKKIELKKDIPTIICVVKDEIDKINTFLDHYKSLGEFNFVFVDNGSTDGTLEILLNEPVMIYQVLGKFSTIRKLAWINKVYLNLPINNWYLLLDVDELMVYKGYEANNFNYFLSSLPPNTLSVGALMIDMFAVENTNKHYMETYKYFENSFTTRKSFYFEAIYGGFRQRAFNDDKKSLYLIKKHPLLYNDGIHFFCHCHYNYPYESNFKSSLMIGLLHYKLYANEMDKYKKIAMDKGYAFGSAEYKKYIEVLSNKEFSTIFINQKIR